MYVVWTSLRLSGIFYYYYCYYLLFRDSPKAKACRGGLLQIWKQKQISGRRWDRKEEESGIIGKEQEGCQCSYSAAIYILMTVTSFLCFVTATALSQYCTGNDHYCLHTNYRNCQPWGSTVKLRRRHKVIAQPYWLLAQCLLQSETLSKE